jgi:hypothetical protein
MIISLNNQAGFLLCGEPVLSVKFLSISVTILIEMRSIGYQAPVDAKTLSHIIHFYCLPASGKHIPQSIFRFPYLKKHFNFNLLPF